MEGTGFRSQTLTDFIPDPAMCCVNEAGWPPVLPELDFPVRRMAVSGAASQRPGSTRVVMTRRRLPGTPQARDKWRLWGHILHRRL